MKVKITKCISGCEWYSEMIGEIVEVEEWEGSRNFPLGTTYQLVTEYEREKGRVIDKGCCEVITQQPLGLRPKFIVDSLRIKEIVSAISRYAEVDKKIPKEWLDELTDLNKGSL